MSKEYYKGIEKIKYEGAESDNPLAFKYYDPNKILNGIKIQIQFKQPKIKLMLHLNLFKKWALIISAFMILI